jgi:5-methylcytosine-specific restriction endonuclease McrA
MKGKLAGDKHPAWCGGISQKYKKGYENTYPAAFNKELRLIILSRDTHICQHCKCTDDLTVHHIDYDKHNNDISNLIACCRSCNGKFNVNREQWAAYWKEYQQNRVIGR